MPDIDIQHVVQTLIILILSIAVHEYGHAKLADWLGDDLPRSQGRVTLNPVVHADPWGTLAFPAVFLVLSGGLGFGWGRPVQINPRSFSRRMTMKRGHMLVAAAGPFMNIFFGVFISLVAVTLLSTGVLSPDHELAAVLSFAVFLNFVLAFFNLIPSHPLDGGAVMAGLLPDRYSRPFTEFTEKYGFFVLLIFLWSPKLAQLFVWPAVKLFQLWGTQTLGLPWFTT